MTAVGEPIYNMDPDDAENRWRKAANARWERFKKQQTTGDKKAKALAAVQGKRPGPGQTFPGIKRDGRIRKPSVLPQPGAFVQSAPRPRKPATEEDNPWRRAANARWEKHRLQSGASTPVPRAKPQKARPTRKGEPEDGLQGVFDEETMGLEGEELETFKKMCDSVFSKINRLSGDSRRLIKEFLAGQYDDDVNGTQNIVLNDEIVAHPDVPGKYCRETLSLEMDYSKGKWRKIKRRWKSPIDVEKLAEVGIPVAESGRDDGQEPEEARFDGGMAGGEEGPDEDADGEPEEADADADADGDAELSVDAGMDDS